MEEKRCVFCGQKPGILQSAAVYAANIEQTACRSCEKELKDLEEIDICRRALIHGLAIEPERLKKRILFLSEAEEKRPKCLRCGGKLAFMREQWLDNSPYGDSIFHAPFSVIPAFCGACGKFEFYHPSILRMDKYLAALYDKDIRDV